MVPCLFFLEFNVPYNEAYHGGIKMKEFTRGPLYVVYKVVVASQLVG
jgi:hypothetical protein